MLLEKQIDTLQDELTDVRTRVTEVAELFERKPITQKYSFEVLCDFIIDKAKRLFSKYEAVSKERKVMAEESKYYYQRKIDSLEDSLQELRLGAGFADRVADYIVPRV